MPLAETCLNSTYYEWLTNQLLPKVCSGHDNILVVFRENYREFVLVLRTLGCPLANHNHSWCFSIKTYA